MLIANKAGAVAHALLPYGLNDGTFAEVFGGFALLFDTRRRDAEFEQAGGEKSSLSLVAGQRRVAVSEEDLIAQTEGTPGLPEQTGIAQGLARWTLEAVRLRPLLIPGYAVLVQENALPVVRQHHGPEIELLARWTRPAFESNSEATGGMGYSNSE
jgi:hypothetical protein